jgi:hypothetical protein
MKLRHLLLSAILLLGGAVWAASALDAQRSAVKAGREQVTSLRAEQLSKRSELSKLSSRIEALKASQQGALLPGSELDAALKSSQELSASLTTLAQQLSARDGELESAQLALLDGLSQELSRLRAEFDRQTDRAARKATIERMKSVRQERESIRAALPATRLPAMDALRPSDDPETLLEQADLLRDREEKLQKELKAVEQRLAEKKEEAELDRRVQRFMGEESLFDDQDRRLRLQRVTESGETRAVPQAPAGSGESGGKTSLSDTSATPTAGAGTPSGTFGGTAGGGSNGTGSTGYTGGTQGAPPASSTSPSVSGSADPSAVKMTTHSETRPLFGGGGTIATGDEDETNDLEVQRNRIKSLADELKKKAAELEKKAAQLK